VVPHEPHAVPDLEANPLMKTLIRLARRLLRRPAPAYRGWQDFELGTYVTDPAPVERTMWIDILPDLVPYQEAMLRHQAWAEHRAALRRSGMWGSL
jgi:hypothetical protein